MKTLEHEYNLFGDFGFNTSINDVKNYAVALSKKTHYDLANILRNHMQDVLAHLIGCKTFFDAIMASTTTYMYALSNHEIGKKKLTEFFSLLVELDSLGIHVDDINLYKNDVDKILEKELLKTPKVNRIYINYLSFNNLNDFFERVIQIFEIKPLFNPAFVNLNNLEQITPFIADPSDFDYSKLYLDYNDFFMKIGTSAILLNLKRGNIVDAREWITEYRKRYCINKLYKFKNKDGKQSEEQDLINETFSKEDIDELKRLLIEKEEEIKKLKETLENLRETIRCIVKDQGIDFTDEEFNKFETEYILQKLSEQLKKKSKLKNNIKYMFYAMALAGLLFSQDIKLDKGEKSTSSTIESVEKPYVELPEFEDKTIDDEPFVIGNKVNVGIPYYISSTSDIQEGISTKEGIIIGYFATLKENGQNILLKGFRNQEQITEYLNNYTGDTSEISWRAAVCTSENDELKRLIENGEEIPYTYTTYYIDYNYEKAKEFRRVKNVTK